MKKKYHLKKKFKIIFVIILIAAIAISAYLYIDYRLSNKYKFKELGYKENEIKLLLKFDENFQEKLINLGYDDNILDIIQEKYFIQKNFDRYLKYQKKHRTDEIEVNEVIAKVNINRDKEYYENTKKTDISKNNLMLVNKYHHLEETFVPKNILKASSWYSYDGINASKESYEAFIKMFKSAKKDGIKLILNSGYRSYKEQKDVYVDFDKNYGEEYADNYAARPGFSEHQTGLAYDIIKPGATAQDFEKTDEYKWLEKNAHKYGFILRYPKGKEDYTGFKYESWHYRYVGVENAIKIKKEGITFDEYYAYYIENK